MGNQHGKTTSQPRRCRQVRFTDAEWAELQQGAQAIGETRSEAIRAGAMSRVRQSIPDASDVTPGASEYASALTLAERAVEANSKLPDAFKSLPARRVFACAYCPAEFCTSFDTEAHIDTMHPQEAS